MLYQILIPAPVLMIPILIMTTKGTHSPKNDSGLPSDVIVTYSNHAEVSREDRIPVVDVNTTTANPTTPKQKQYKKEGENAKKFKPKHKRPHKQSFEVVDEPIQEDVVFIPNEREEAVRNEYYLQKEHSSLSDLLGGRRTIDDLQAPKDVRLETESPVSDIIFVIGKNNDNVETVKEQDRGARRQNEARPRGQPTPAPKLNCTNLICNNAIKSVCGERIDDDYKQKLRLFLNDCYFRKVNCNFKNAGSRYKKVMLEKCKNIGSHSLTPFTFSFRPAPKFEMKPPQVNDTRRNTSSRRSMTLNIHGQFCSHACPVSCSEHYEPECAVSSTGRYRVFVNHCALDHNSCSFGIVWHSVPLAQCVGGKKADMRQNAGFIGWMQRVGIVDKKGRLAYDVE